MSMAATTSTDSGRRIEELGRIILAYSEVTEKLQQSHDQLQQTVLALRDELGEKNRLLERRNRLAALGEMAAGMAHEIRNPLGGIQLYASLLAKNVADRPESAQLVEKIAGGVRRLDGVVSQVLQFAREMRPNAVPTDLRQIIEEALGLAARTIESRGVRAELHGPAALPVQVDSGLIVQAVLNLILNAAEAMDRGGALIVRAGGPAQGARQFWLIVEDTGPGIPAGVLDRIFNPFFTTKDQGTGLGLAIVHRIIEAHDGTIRAGNRTEGGARFEVRV
jgi:two-component system sensor histidine kinase HydH